ncbi:hypothetical protein [Streptomyces sp. NPDC005302]|uniref:hypothetical protein n=1 Tax=Streptomyces sp. NPDC005302 TaxID=3154675 RepID=UPI0033B7B5F6
MSARDVLETNIDPAVPDGGGASIDAYRAEVLAEADLLPKADVVTWLVKKAREIPRGNKIGRAQGDVIAVMASKVARGAVRPDNLRMLPPDFFEPGHTYSAGPWDFNCAAVTTHPETGERVALGWTRINGGAWTTYSHEGAEWPCGWADVTKEGGR